MFLITLKLPSESNARTEMKEENSMKSKSLTPSYIRF